MAFQAEVGSGTNRATDYHDLLSKTVGFLTSQHVATVAVNSGGSGYTVGDILTLTHAGALLDAKFEVTTVSAGVITGLRINCSGAFSSRGTSATVSAGGSGYAVGDVLEVQGGTARENAKFQVATLSGSAVATVTAFETGGAYSSTPSNPAATVGVGPAAFAGNDACTLTVTYSGLIGTTGLSVTGGTGSSATVDITLAQTGWSVDSRNVNNYTYNSVTNEKQVVLVGDATGLTNKPYIGFVTGTTSGVDTRYGIGVHGMVAHNPALGYHEQAIMSPGINATTGVLEVGAYLCTPQNQAQEIDFWIQADDLHALVQINDNPAAATTDDGIYMHAHVGFMNRYGTEVENPYPMLVGASGRLINFDPSVSTVNVSCMPECIGPTSSNTGWFFYEAESSTWKNVENGENLSAAQKNYIMWPFGNLTRLDSSTDPDYIVGQGPITTYDTWSSVTRGTPSKKLLPVPGSTPKTYLWKVNAIARVGSTTDNDVKDGPRGEIRNFFWLTATDSSGNKISNFAEDYMTDDSGNRYRVFHNHVNTGRDQYYAILEDT